MRPEVPAPIIQEIKAELFRQKRIKLYVQREDLRHPFGMGNKWWKLKYNLEDFINSPFQTVLSFGGAYSNHIHALAALCHEKKIPSIGVIRGEKPKVFSPTLKFAENHGMKLHFVSRSQYRLKQQPEFLSALEREVGPFYHIPEGGTNQLAVKGASQMLSNHHYFDWVVAPVGTGGTLAGIVNSLNLNQRALGISVLKGAFDLDEIVKNLAHNDNFEINHNYHFGGYAKKTPLLESFIAKVKLDHGIPLDHVYTGKIFSACFDLISKDFFKPKSHVLIVHTGGLQGAQLVI